MRLKLFAVVILALGLQACATSGGPPPMSDAALTDPSATTQLPSPDLQGGVVPAVVGIPADPGSIGSYRIGPYDLLQIQVFQVDELSRTERVSEDGYVVMPLIGAVRVGGLSQREAEKAIADKLAERYLQNPQVSIFVAEYASQKVTVIGQVKKPGVFPLAGRTTLMQAIALAGGFDDAAKKGEVVVFRKQPSGEVNAYVVDLAAVQEGRLSDPVIVGDDRVVVPKSGAAALGKAVGNVLTGWAIRVPLL
jgi:polysaccharide export outer membrane protein